MTMVLGEIIPKIVEKHLKGGTGKEVVSGTKSSYELNRVFKKYTNTTNNPYKNYNSVFNIARRIMILDPPRTFKVVDDAVTQGMIDSAEADEMLEQLFGDVKNKIKKIPINELTKKLSKYKNIPLIQNVISTNKPQITQKQEEEIIEQITEADPALKKILEQQEKDKEEKEKKTKQLTKELNDTVEALENTKKALQSKLPKDKTKLEEIVRDKTVEIEDLKAQYVKNLQAAQEKDDTGKLKATDDQLKIIPIINQNIKNDIESLEKLVDKTKESIETIIQEEQSEKDKIILLDKEKEKVIKRLKRVAEEEEIRKEKKAKKEKYEKEAELQPLVSTKIKSSFDHLKEPESLKNVRVRLTKRDK
jgi:chromosome segregation ATPase